jgi:hypothetical protein
VFLHSDTLTTIVPVIVVQIITALLVRVEDAEGDLVVVVLNVLLEKHQALELGTYLNALRALLENIFLAINVYLVLLESINLIQDKQAVIRVVVAPILVVVPRAVLIVV